jgi:VanZ family protein
MLKLYAGAIFVAVFVIIAELSQLFIASRTFDLADLAADFVGIILASWAAKYLAMLSLAKTR